MFARSTCMMIKLNYGNSFRTLQTVATGRGLFLLNCNNCAAIGRTGGAILRRNVQQQQKRAETADFANLRVVWNKLFGKYLLATNVLSSGLLMVIGDIMAQEIEYRRGLKDRYDLKRIGRMFIVGALQGPLHHYVYNWMDRIMPKANTRNILRKILIDQIFMSPACILIFFYSACYLERKSVTETNTELVEKFPFIYAMDWLLWPGAQYINFRYLDTKYRVMFVNICTAVYNVFMSYMKHDFDSDFFDS